MSEFFSTHSSKPVKLGLVNLVISGVGGVVYYQLYPEIKTSKRNIPQSNKTHEDTPPLNSVLKTLKEDERKVLNVLMRMRAWFESFLRFDPWIGLSYGSRKLSCH